MAFANASYVYTGRPGHIRRLASRHTLVLRLVCYLAGRARRRPAYQTRESRTICSYRFRSRLFNLCFLFLLG